MSVLIVGGRFGDKNYARPSGYVRKFAKVIEAIEPRTMTFNGGSWSELKNIINEYVREVDFVFWFAEVPNNKPKLVRDIKRINPKCILVSSKRNNQEYSALEVVARALQSKSNLVIEFFRKDGLIQGSVIDPLGNWFGTATSPEQLAVTTYHRAFTLSKYTRKQSIRYLHADAFDIPCDDWFIEKVKHYANRFHKLIHGVANPSRLLGNVSFRCEAGFSSFRKDEFAFISKRNLDKRDIGPKGFVPVYLSSDQFVNFVGSDKPSVDAPIHVRLYNYYPRIKYMLHSHVYVDEAVTTCTMIPCGALEEFHEIIMTIPSRQRQKFAINLKGHGSIVAGSKPEHFDDIPYIARSLMPSRG